jgi:hypothetical protein
MANNTPGLPALETPEEETKQQGFLANAPKGKGLSPSGQIAMDPKQTAELLANMQSMVDERTGAFNTFMSGLKDASAWGSGGERGPSAALALREEAKNKEYSDVYNMRTQMAAYRAAQAQQEAYNEEQRRIFGGNMGGGGGGGAATGGAGGAPGAGTMYKGVMLDPETAVAMAQARSRDDRDKIFNDFASKRAQARGSFEYGAPTYKNDIKFVTPDGRLQYIDAATAKQYRDQGYGQVIGPATPQSAPSQGRPSNVPVSVRNNNPGNIVDPKTGEIRTYATREEGDRALEEDLKGKLTGQSPAYKSRFGEEPVTPARLAEVWAPANAKGNTPESTANYGKFIAKTLNVGANEPIEYTPENLGKIKAAITQFEAGTPVSTAKAEVVPRQPTSAAPRRQLTIPEAEAVAAGQKTRAEAEGTAAGKYLGGAEATVREASSTSGERLASLDYLDGLINNPKTSRVFGVFEHPNFASAIGKVVDDGIKLGRLGDVGVDLAPIVRAVLPNATQEETDAVQKATREFAKIKLNEAKILLAGQGAVSDAERGLVQELSGSIKNSPGALRDYLAWGKMRAEYDRNVGSAFKEYRRGNPGTTFSMFLDTGKADELRDAYDAKLFEFAKKTGIDMSKAAADGSKQLQDQAKPKTAPMTFSDPEKEKRYQLYKQQQRGQK